MKRRSIALRLFYAALVGAVVFLSLLPSLGWIWHSVLPEHQHFAVGTLREDSPGSPVFAASDCAECMPGETVLHVPSFGAFQIEGVALSSTLVFCLPIPDEIITRVLAPSLYLSAPTILRLDPPPKST